MTPQRDSTLASYDMLDLWGHGQGLSAVLVCQA